MDREPKSPRHRKGTRSNSSGNSSLPISAMMDVGSVLSSASSSASSSTHAKEQLFSSLNKRPGKEELVYHNIIAGGGHIDPKLQPQMKSLIKSMKEDKLSMRLAMRRSVVELAQQGIIPTPQLGSQMAVAQKALDQQMKKDRLSAFLKTRVPIEQIVEKKQAFVGHNNTMTWMRQLTTGLFPTPRNCHSLSSLGPNKMALIGGYGAQVESLEVDILDIKLGGQYVWSKPVQKGSLPEHRYSHVALMLNVNTILVFGGFSIGGEWLNDVHLMVFGTDTVPNATSPQLPLQTKTKTSPPLPASSASSSPVSSTTTTSASSPAETITTATIETTTMTTTSTTITATPPSPMPAATPPPTPTPAPTATTGITTTTTTTGTPTKFGRSASTTARLRTVSVPFATNVTAPEQKEGDGTPSTAFSHLALSSSSLSSSSSSEFSSSTMASPAAATFPGGRGLFVPSTANVPPRPASPSQPFFFSFSPQLPSQNNPASSSSPSLSPFAPLFASASSTTPSTFGGTSASSSTGALAMPALSGSAGAAMGGEYAYALPSAVTGADADAYNAYHGYNGVVPLMGPQVVTWVQPMVTGFPPSPRAGHSAVFIGKKVYIFGGNDGAQMFNDVHVLDTSVTPFRWSRPDIAGIAPSKRAGHTACAINKDQMVVFGGGNHAGALNDIHIFDTKAMTWRAPRVHGTAPEGRAGHSACVIFESLLVVFGGGHVDRVSNDVHVFNGITNLWSRPSDVGTLPSPRAGHSCILLGDSSLHIFGGGDRESVLNDLYVLDASYLSQAMNVTPTFIRIRSSSQALLPHAHTQASGSLTHTAVAASATTAPSASSSLLASSSSSSASSASLSLSSQNSRIASAASAAKAAAAAEKEEKHKGLMERGKSGSVGDRGDRVARGGSFSAGLNKSFTGRASPSSSPSPSISPPPPSASAGEAEALSSAKGNRHSTTTKKKELSCSTSSSSFSVPFKTATSASAISMATITINNAVGTTTSPSVSARTRAAAATTTFLPSPLNVPNDLHNPHHTLSSINSSKNITSSSSSSNSSTSQIDEVIASSSHKTLKASLSGQSGAGSTTTTTVVTAPASSGLHSKSPPAPFVAQDANPKAMTNLAPSSSLSLSSFSSPSSSKAALVGFPESLSSSSSSSASSSLSSSSSASTFPSPPSYDAGISSENVCIVPVAHPGKAYDPTLASTATAASAAPRLLNSSRFAIASTLEQVDAVTEKVASIMEKTTGVIASKQRDQLEQEKQLRLLLRHIESQRNEQFVMLHQEVQTVTRAVMDELADLKAMVMACQKKRKKSKKAALSPSFSSSSSSSSSSASALLPAGTVSSTDDVEK